MNEEHQIEKVRVFIVQKFFPPRCPKCEHAFRSLDDYGIWGGSGTSFGDSIQKQRMRLPELFKTEIHDSNLVITDNKYGIDFILCRHCQNITMRIQYGTRQVLTRAEAERLIETRGFTSWQEGVGFGNMARETSSINFLGQADLVYLQEAVLEAREKASKQIDPFDLGDAFMGELDPALSEFVKKHQEKQTTIKVREQLKAKFNDTWSTLSVESRNFLVTADTLLEELRSYSETDSAIDFSPAVALYSKALEIDLSQKLFRAFAASSKAKELRKMSAKGNIGRSLKALGNYVDGQLPLTLGQMGYCLLNLGCKARMDPFNSFTEFLRSVIFDLDTLCDDLKFPQRVIEYVSEYRNRAAHVGRLSYEECIAARDYLINEPIRLLITLEKQLTEKS